MCAGHLGSTEHDRSTSLGHPSFADRIFIANCAEVLHVHADRDKTPRTLAGPSHSRHHGGVDEARNCAAVHDARRLIDLPSRRKTDPGVLLTQLFDDKSHVKREVLLLVPMRKLSPIGGFVGWERSELVGTHDCDTMRPLVIGVGSVRITPSEVVQTPATMEQMTPRRLTNVTAACTIVVAYLTWQLASRGWLYDFDRNAIVLARRLDVNRTFFEITVSFGLRGAILTIFVPILAWLSWTRRSWIPLGGFLVVLLFETGMVGALKMVMERPFPYRGQLLLEAPKLAFPSGHATNSVALWGYLAWFFTRGLPHRRGTARNFVVFAAVTTGVSSWLIRTHWPTDLFAGYAIGGIALATGIAFIEAVERAQLSREASALR